MVLGKMVGLDAIFSHVFPVRQGKTPGFDDTPIPLFGGAALRRVAPATEEAVFGPR
jgi:hypothetical protein